MATLIDHVEQWLSGRSITIVDISVPGESWPNLSDPFPQAVVMPGGPSIYAHRTTDAVIVQFITEISKGAENHNEKLLELIAAVRDWNDVILYFEIPPASIVENAFLMTEITLEDNRG